MADASRTISKITALLKLLGLAKKLKERKGSKPRQMDGWLLRGGDMPPGFELWLVPVDEPDVLPPSRQVVQLAPLEEKPDSIPDAIPFISGFRLRVIIDEETRLAVWLQFSGSDDYEKNLVERLSAEELEQLRSIAKIHNPVKLGDKDKREVLDTYVRLVHETSDPVESNALRSAWMQVLRDSVIAGWDSITDVQNGLQIKYVDLRNGNSRRRVILCEFGPLRYVGLEDILVDDGQLNFSG